MSSQPNNFAGCERRERLSQSRYIGTAEGALMRAAASTQPFGRWKETVGAAK